MSIIRSELGIITTTAVLRRCVKAVTSPQLLQGTVHVNTFRKQPKENMHADWLKTMFL